MSDRYERNVLQVRLVEEPVFVLWQWADVNKQRPPRLGILSAWKQTQTNNMHPLWYGLVTWVDMSEDVPLVTTEWVWNANFHRVPTPDYWSLPRDMD